jgi:hypothetical protein
MSMEEYQARQRANAVQNAASAQMTSVQKQISDARRHVMKALELLGSDTPPEVVTELQKALATLKS